MHVAMKIYDLCKLFIIFNLQLNMCRQGNCTFREKLYLLNAFKGIVEVCYASSKSILKLNLKYSKGHLFIIERREKCRLHKLMMSFPTIFLIYV